MNSVNISLFMAKIFYENVAINSPLAQDWYRKLIHFPGLRARVVDAKNYGRKKLIPEQKQQCNKKTAVVNTAVVNTAVINNVRKKTVS
jgi:hypothetical protein